MKFKELVKELEAKHTVRKLNKANGEMEVYNQFGDDVGVMIYDEKINCIGWMDCGTSALGWEIEKLNNAEVVRYEFTDKAWGGYSDNKKRGYYITVQELCSS